MSTMLREKIVEAFKILKAQDKTLTPYKIAQEAKTNYSNLRDALEGKVDNKGRVRKFSDGQLQDLGNCPIFPYSYEYMRQLKAQDDYPDLNIGSKAPELPEKITTDWIEANMNDLSNAIAEMPEEQKIKFIRQIATAFSEPIEQLFKDAKKYKGK